MKVNDIIGVKPKGLKSTSGSRDNLIASKTSKERHEASIEKHRQRMSSVNSRKSVGGGP